MSTIASPRPSVSIKSPVGSTRTSLDVPSGSIRSTSPRARRNRTALRDYYGLKAPADASSGAQGLGIEAVKEEIEISELDKQGFDAEAYVKDILAKEGLEGVLKVEAGLVSQIRGLDGERKALVYDNYSKLIAATETIRKMRTNMDPLTPATSTLSPAISHIAETAAALSASITDHAGIKAKAKQKDDPKEKQRQTVRWVLDTPRRLRIKVSNGEREAAEADWEEVRKVLDKWGTVKGADELCKMCEEIITGEYGTD